MRGRVLERGGRVLGQGGRELVLACMEQDGGRGGRAWGGSQGRPRPHTYKTKQTRKYTIKILYCLLGLPKIFGVSFLKIQTGNWPKT